MKKQLPSPQELTSLPATEAKKILLKNFRWLLKRENKKILEDALQLENTFNPPCNFTFRWHLPRFIATIRLLNRLFADKKTSGLFEVLDVSPYPPFALLIKIKSAIKNAAFEYTSLSGGPVCLESALGALNVKTFQTDLNRDVSLPKERFDCVLLTEVIEHINRHPELVVRDITASIKLGGYLVLSTPNAASWKKIYNLSKGDFEFDAPTFGPELAHRHEYTHYQISQILSNSGFKIDFSETRDVYLDDKKTLASKIQFAALIASKIATGQLRQAARLILRGGSTLFFIARKEGPPKNTGPIRI